MPQAKIKPMFAGGMTMPPFDPNDPNLQFPQMPPDEMDPTAAPPLPRPPMELSRFDAPPPDMGGGSGSGMPEMPNVEAPPPPMDAIGRDPRFRQLAVQQKMNQDQAQAPPPMGGLKNQGAAQQQAIDYAQRILMDPNHPGQFKKPSVLQDVLGAVAPRVNWHPNLTREYQNYELLKSRADEERKMQQAQANEQIKEDTLATNAAYRNNLLASKGTTQPRLTGDAQKVALLEEGYKGQPGMTPEMARELALRDYKAEFTFPKGEWSKAGVIVDPKSTTGYSARMYNRRTSETKDISDVVPGVGYFGTTTETSTEHLVPQANGDVGTATLGSSVTRSPNIHQAGQTAPVMGQAEPTPAPALSTTAPRIVGHRTPAPPASTKPQTYAIPDGKGGFNLQTFGPGDTIPPGAVNQAGVNKANTNAAESQELTPAGQTQMKEVDVVSKQFDDLLQKLEPYKKDNNPATLWGPMAKYKLGMSTPQGELGNEISNLSLASIQGMMPFASKSRNYQFIKDIGQHLPHLSVVHGIDSPALIYDKLTKAKANFDKMRASITRYEVKHAKPDATPATGETGGVVKWGRDASGNPVRISE